MSAILMALAAAPHSAHADWTLGAAAGVRHDDNVGNAQYSRDIEADTTVAARLSWVDALPTADGYLLTVGGDLSGERFGRLEGLDNASLGASLALRKKWGMGAFTPWIRGGVSLARAAYDDHERNAWISRATLAAGRRIDPRWNAWIEYSFERRAATTREESVVPTLSSDAFSQNGHHLALNLEHALSERWSVSLAANARQGDVVSSTQPHAKIYSASRALAEDPAFGDEFYAYRLRATSYGVRIGFNYAPTAHSLLGCGFRRLETHAQGGNDYTKSVPEITWDYRF